MILGMEIALTVYGLMLLITGKTFGKSAYAHWRLRLVGGFLMTLLPVAFVAAIIMGIVWAIQNPGADAATAGEQLRWPITGMEFGLAIIYVIIATFWEKSIRKQAV